MPLIPYLLGFESLWAGLACGGLGLLITGALAAKFTRKAPWWSSLRLLALGGAAIAVTYLVGSVVGVVVT